MKINKENAEHFSWNDGNCDAWHFLKGDELSIISQKMPAGEIEGLHYHEKAKQYFYILSGKAVIKIEGIDTILEKGEGIEVAAKIVHQMLNPHEEPLEFLVVSTPTPIGDRVSV